MLLTDLDFQLSSDTFIKCEQSALVEVKFNTCLEKVLINSIHNIFHACICV